MHSVEKSSILITTVGSLRLCSDLRQVKKQYLSSQIKIKL